MKITELKKRYDEIVTDYILAFCRKHKCYIESFVGDEKDGIACVADCFLHFNEIKLDIDLRVNKDLIWEWYYKNVNAHMEDDDRFPNFENWLKLNKKKKVKK